MEALIEGSFGNNTGPIYLDDLMCTGWESNLENCIHSGIGVHNCNHNQDVAMACSVSGEINLVIFVTAFLVIFVHYCRD